ncbi:Uncharacterised protein [Vibrio cholerae]|nr:Uncharacterised protein [Vibrio cholerae]CSI32152.1 Uncharacterised protein [Vibrio cholerae]
MSPLPKKMPTLSRKILQLWDLLLLPLTYRCTGNVV